VIGTGIFVLTAEAAQKAGPGMMLSFVIAGFVCAVAALCYAEMAAMVRGSGSAYTYSYAVMGELIAWMVGWALIWNTRWPARSASAGRAMCGAGGERLPHRHTRHARARPMTAA
jgi:APA family basic amino acid/polyamine antiporter